MKPSEALYWQLCMCAYIVGAGVVLTHENVMGLFEMQVFVAKRSFAGTSV